MNEKHSFANGNAPIEFAKINQPVALIKAGEGIDRFDNVGKNFEVAEGCAAHMAIGVKADGTVVIVSATAKMTKLCKIMAELGCMSVMNLDGGDSSALCADGWRVKASRDLSKR